MYRVVGVEYHALAYRQRGAERAHYGLSVAKKEWE